MQKDFPWETLSHPGLSRINALNEQPDPVHVKGLPFLKSLAKPNFLLLIKKTNKIKDSLTTMIGLKIILKFSILILFHLLEMIDYCSSPGYSTGLVCKEAVKVSKMAVRSVPWAHGRKTITT